MTQHAGHMVSVIIPTHNRRKLLQRALTSVLRQTYEPLEIVVVDDGSSDDTNEFVSNLLNDHPCIKYLKHSRPKGAPAARNYGIREAKGEFLTFLDDDDELLPDNIKCCMQHYSDEYAYVCSGYTRITTQKRYDILPKRIITYDSMLYKITTGNQILTRKERIRKLGGFDETLLSSQDYDMWLRLNKKYGDARCVKKPLIIMHTEHKHARITSSSRKIKGALAFYRKHKEEMNIKQKKYQLFYILKLKRKQINLRKFLSFVPVKYYWPEIKYYLLVNYSKLSKIKHT